MMLEGAGLCLVTLILVNLGLAYSFPSSTTHFTHSGRNSTSEAKFYTRSSQEVQGPAPGVRLHYQDNHVVLDNGILQVTLSSPEGSVTKIRYNGIANLLEELKHESNRGYWDMVWKGSGVTRKKGNLDRLNCTDFKVIVETDEQVEVSFTRTWNSSLAGKLPPLNIDKRFTMLRGSSGFYTYAIYNHPKEFPGFTLTNTRLAFKLNKLWFNYMAIGDNRQRKMPLPDDRSPERSQPLAYPEAVHLTEPIEEEFKGEVDDKYQYSGEAKDIQVHGWICNDPPTGFWQITPSNEFRSAGPTKQYLTSHVGPTSLSVLLSTHYAGKDLMAKFEDGEPWKKVLGPLFVYVNSQPKGDDHQQQLWEDAKRQVDVEAKNWPYSFAISDDYPSSDQRGSISGTLLIYDRYLKTNNSARGAHVGLAAPGEAGSWQRESKGYQFWTRADEDGHFKIDKIRPSTYNLYAWVPGLIGDYRYDGTLNITTGHVDVGDLLYIPPRDGPTLWEIGVPNRSAGELFIPDPNPKLLNKLYVDTDKYRQYGLWDRYTDLYPHKDLVYVINVSDYKKDWFFAQVNRKINNTYQGTTWQIRFPLDNVYPLGTYTLRIVLASATSSELQVRVNDRQGIPLFSTGVIGHDNTIARHGTHGLYWLYNASVPGGKFVLGNNTIFFTQTMGLSPWIGILYDYIRLEGPPSSYDNSN